MSNRQAQPPHELGAEVLLRESLSARTFGSCGTVSGALTLEQGTRGRWIRMHDGRPEEVRRDLAKNGHDTVEALLTGGDPRSLRNADVVIDDASRYPERLDELVQCVFSDDEIVRMRASDALEKVCRSRPGLLRRFVPRLLAEMSRIEQASVQWHLAQILAEVQLDEGERAEAIAILERNLDTSGDWIVTNLTLQALAVFARTSPAVRARLVGRLRRFLDSRHKSVASRARKLLAEFDPKPPRARAASARTGRRRSRTVRASPQRGLGRPYAGAREQCQEDAR